MTTATLPRRLMRPVATHPARRQALTGFAATLAVGLVALAAASAAIGLSAGSSVLAGVSVGGVELAGLDRSAAAARLEADLPALHTGQATIRVGDSETALSYAELGRGYELDAMLDAAMAVGRDGNPLADGVERLRSLVHPTTLPVVVHAFDPEILEASATEIAAAMSVAPLEAAARGYGEASFGVREGHDGRRVDAAAVATAVGDALATTSPADVSVTITAQTVRPIVDTPMAQAAADAAEAMAVDVELTLPGNEESLSLGAASIADAITFGPMGAEPYAARLDAGSIGAAVAALATDVDREAVNARIGVNAAGGLGGVVAGQDGRALDVEATTTSLLSLLDERAGGGRAGSLALAVNVTQPSFTTAEAEEVRPRMQLVSTWTTYYVPGESNGFGNNINIPARDIDGRNLYPGEWFSFWGSIGPVTFERGYMYGGVIVNGRSQPTGAIGGGICSTSTTVFNAALRMGLEIGDRANHSYYIDRYPLGLDATVLIDGDNVQDMTFRNDTEHPIVIRGFGGNGAVTFQMWSVPTGRSVAIGDAVTSNHRGAIDTTVVDASMAPGTSKRVEFPHDGLDVVRNRTVYAADGSVLHQDTFFSGYRVVNGVVAVGPSGSSSAATDSGGGGTAGGGVVGGDAGDDSTP
jgi:vancomycin resistance protein YoaR